MKLTSTTQERSNAEQERPFNFDLEEMEKAMSSGMIELPDCITDIDLFDAWLNENF